MPGFGLQKPTETESSGGKDDPDPAANGEDSYVVLGVIQNQCQKQRKGQQEGLACEKQVKPPR